MKESHELLSYSEQNVVDLNKWQETVNLLVELFGASSGAIVQLHQSEFNVITTSQNDDNILHTGQSWPLKEHGFCRHVMESDSDLYVGNAPKDKFWCDAPCVAIGSIRSYHGHPIYWPDGTHFGTICVIDIKSTQYSSTLKKVLAQLARLLMADLKTSQDHQTLQNLALTDEMTGLYNRRGLTILGKQKLKDAKRYQSSIGVIYLDIDNLKTINDKFGHKAGDHCINVLAHILREKLRESDIIARIGGDEFIVISLLGSRLELTALAHRLEQHYANEVSGNIQLESSSVSCGTSIIDCYSPLPFEQLLEEADHNMYQQKKKKKLFIK